MNKQDKILKRLLEGGVATLKSILVGGKEVKDCITWLQLYKELTDRANKITNIGKFNWQDAVIFRNEESGDEYPLSLEQTTYADGSNRLILVCKYPRCDGK